MGDLKFGSKKRSSVYNKAMSFAISKHQGQLRKDGSPYIHHPIAVSQRAMEIALRMGLSDSRGSGDPEPGGVEIVAAAGLLHDTIEDCGCSFEDIVNVAGVKVADIVATVSADKRLPSDRRLDEYCTRLKTGGQLVQIVKLADITCNALDCLALLWQPNTVYDDDHGGFTPIGTFAAKWHVKASRMLETLINIDQNDLVYCSRILNRIRSKLPQE